MGEGSAGALWLWVMHNDSGSLEVGGGSWWTKEEAGEVGAGSPALVKEEEGVRRSSREGLASVVWWSWGGVVLPIWEGR